MAWFFQRSQQVDPTVEDQIKKLTSKVSVLESQVLELYTAHDIIRNKVLKKLQYRRKDMGLEEDEEDTNDPKTQEGKLIPM